MGRDRGMERHHLGRVAISIMEIQAHRPVFRRGLQQTVWHPGGQPLKQSSNAFTNQCCCDLQVISDPQIYVMFDLHMQNKNRLRELLWALGPGSCANSQPWSPLFLYLVLFVFNASYSECPSFSAHLSALYVAGLLHVGT